MTVEFDPPVAGPDGKLRQQEVRLARESAEPQGNGLDTQVQKARFELIPFDKIAFETVPAYLVKGLVPRVCLSVFWGPPKCGKSFLVFDLLTRIMHRRLADVAQITDFA